MKENNIYVVRTDVGDKNVVDTMRQNNYNLGGEQSGHIIHLDHSTTGDGCVAALNVIAVMQSANKPLSALRTIMKDVPQVLINTRVSERKELSAIPGYDKLISDIQKKLGSEGRLFVRFSGTEPVVRVLVEGPDKAVIGRFAEEIAGLLQQELS